MCGLRPNVPTKANLTLEEKAGLLGAGTTSCAFMDAGVRARARSHCRFALLLIHFIYQNR
jgi:hypothetical protein